MDGQGKIAANGHQDGKNHNGDIAEKNEDNAAVSNESLQPVPIMKERAQLVAHTEETPNLVADGSTHASNDCETQVSTNSEHKKPSNDVVIAEPVRKSQRTRLPSFKYANDNNDEPLAPKFTDIVAESDRDPRTPQELYNRIKKSHDKLFYIAYSHNEDPLIVTDKAKKDNGRKEYRWYLVRVDLSTCQQLEDTENCEMTGKYYVEFYEKASYDQGILLPGNPLENGIPKAKMKPKADSDSRYWLECMTITLTRMPTW